MLLPFSFDRVIRSVERVKERLYRATAALERAGVPYAVAGGNAVAAWVARVDESLVRNTRDVDILSRRDDLDAAKVALENAGFLYHHVASIDVFLDGADSKAGDAVHIVFGNEKVRDHESVANPDVTESVQAESYRVLTLEALVQSKLTAFQRKDQVHLDDLINVGLVDETWPARYPPELAARLQMLLDNRESEDPFITSSGF